MSIFTAQDHLARAPSHALRSRAFTRGSVVLAFSRFVWRRHKLGSGAPVLHSGLLHRLLLWGDSCSLLPVLAAAEGRFVVGGRVRIECTPS